MEDLRTLSEFEQAAARAIAPGPLAYVAGGAWDEVTLAANPAGWRGWALRPRALVDVSVRQTGTTLLGRPAAHPLLVAPTAFQRLLHPDGELATATAAAATGTPMCLSTLATATPAQVAATAPGGRRWFQVYVLRDRGLTRELIDAAVAAGCEALMLTVDLVLPGAREREHRAGFALPAEIVPSMAAAGASGGYNSAALTELIDPSLSWADLDWLAGMGLPVVVKGILTGQDALRCAEHGAAGVVVSNHGGRQLDRAPATAVVLPEVVAAAGDRLDVLVDGGIRRGVDVATALALGARGVLVGRPVLWGLAVGGSAGVQRVLEILLAELDLALGLLGCPQVSDLDASLVRPAAASSAG